MILPSAGARVDHLDHSWIAGKGANQDIHFKKVETLSQVKQTQPHEPVSLF